MRYRRVVLSGELLVAIFTQNQIHTIRCIQGVPEGTKFKYAISEPVYGISIVIEHPSFKELKDGDEIPLQPYPMMEKI